MLKNILIFISGMATMFLLILVILIIYGLFVQSDELQGLTYLPEGSGECITTKNLKVSEVIAPNVAIAEFGYMDEFGDVFNGTKVLLLNDEGKEYYDKELIKMPKNKCAKRVGTYQHFDETIPAVEIK